MARTYKRFPAHSCFRNPRGHVAARRAGLRKSKTPPDSWEDVPFDAQCWLPFKVAAGMAERGYSYQEIVRHIQRKFRLLLDDAEHVAECAEWHRPNLPVGCLGVYKERQG